MSYDPTEKEVSQLNEGRLMRAEADILLPLLAKHKETAIAAIIYTFKGGKLEELPARAATLSALEDIKTEITHKIKRAESLERKIYGGGTNHGDGTGDGPAY